MRDRVERAGFIQRGGELAKGQQADDQQCH